MSNKFFDVIPPEGEVKKREKKEEVSPQEKPKKIFKKPSGKKVKGIVILTVFILLVASAGLFFFQSAEVKVHPQMTDLVLEEEIVVDSSKEKADFVAKVIPGKIVEVRQSVSKEFSATGKTSEEKRATGVIRVYNAYSTSPQVLVASTRFVSASGKLFRSVQRETIPGGHYEGGEFVPGHTDIEVRAAEPGEEYNIEATTFSIPGFAGTERYTAFYGKSFQPMEGGYIGDMPQVRQEDVDRAREEAVNQAKSESRNSLKSKVSEDYEIVEETIRQEILLESASAEAGEATETFNYQAEIKTAALSFKKSHIQEFANNLLNLSLPEKKKIKEDTREFEFSVLKTEAGKADLKVEARAKAYYELDLVAIRKFLTGQTRQEAKIMLENQPGVERAEIDLGAFWNRKFPSKPEEIRVDISF